MKYHLGRLIDHVHIRVADTAAARRFYAAVLKALGHDLKETGPYLHFDEFYISADGPPTAKLHLAFQAGSQAAVERYHKAGLASGGRDNGAPGEGRYHPGYYAAYFSIRTATTSRRCITGRQGGRRRR
jgi:catechol 2,3-dioxygenase-like lactoylglutathione lyase family enzyme